MMLLKHLFLTDCSVKVQEINTLLLRSIAKLIKLIIVTNNVLLFML